MIKFLSSSYSETAFTSKTFALNVFKWQENIISFQGHKGLERNMNNKLTTRICHSYYWIFIYFPLLLHYQTAQTPEAIEKKTWDSVPSLFMGFPRSVSPNHQTVLFCFLRLRVKLLVLILLVNVVSSPRYPW